MSDFETVRWVLELLLIALATVLFWNFRVLKEEVKSERADRDAINKDLQDHKLYCALTYAKNTEFADFVKAVFNKLERIEDKIDKKADKP